MNKVSWVIVAVFLVTRGAPYQGAPTREPIGSQTSRAFVGLVDVPKLFGIQAEILGAQETGQPVKHSTVTLRLEPRRNSAVAAVVAEADDLDTSEVNHPFIAANVYQRSGGWYLLRLHKGTFGWLAPEDAGGFDAYEDLLRHVPDWSIMAEWDRTLAARPGGPQTIHVPRDPRRVIVGYVEAKGRTETIPNSPDADAIIRSRHGGLSRSFFKAANGTELVQFESGVVVPLFDQPDASGTPLRRIVNLDPGLLERSGAGEAPQPLVFGRKPGWFEVALDEGGFPSFRTLKKVWIEDRHEAWTFHPVSREESDLIISVNWGVEDGPAVAIEEIRKIGDSLWVRVEVSYDSECIRVLENLEDQPRVVVATGWMRAHTPGGKPALWFETYCD
jgi:hypothetical protein